MTQRGSTGILAAWDVSKRVMPGVKGGGACLLSLGGGEGGGGGCAKPARES